MARRGGIDGEWVNRAGFLHDPLMLVILGGHVIQPKVRLSIQVMFLHSGFSRNLKFVVQNVTLFYISSKHVHFAVQISHVFCLNL